MDTLIVEQDYGAYTTADHDTWKELMDRQRQLVNSGRLSREYLDGYSQLALEHDRIVNIKAMSDRLEAISGWTLVPVTGLIPNKDFFFMLVGKKYPVNIHIRQPHEIEFSEQPDIFHDVCGHLPLLVNEKFTRFLTSYSITALKYVNNERAIEFLGRLYWFTYEMGVIEEGARYLPYGGAIITSAQEIDNVVSGDTPKHRFDLAQVFTSAYSPFRLQKEYFSIRSFDDLFNLLEDIEPVLIQQLLLPKTDIVLRNYTLNRHIGAGFNNIIRFLNDTQFQFPHAISFVAGQPDEAYFHIEEHLSKFGVFVDHLAEKNGTSREEVINKIGQYSRTKGIINDTVAAYLANDESIHVKGEHIVMTVGAQEAFAVTVTTICNRENDVILIEDPSYIGLSSFAKVFGYSIQGVPIDEDGIDLNLLRQKIIALAEQQKRVKLVYVIPDYQNPSGNCLSIGNRLKLLELAQQYNFLIIEDAVFNSFTYSEKKNPTLKSLDRNNRVIYISSFSKSLFPGIRVGMIVADQVIENWIGEEVLLSDEMSKVKVQLTNNTPAICQTIVGGILLGFNGSLSEWNKPKFISYRNKMNAMLDALDRFIGAFTGDWAAGIGWNRPQGGFYVRMTLPFTVDEGSVQECAAAYNVVFCPMSYFYLDGGGRNEIRLSFSNLSVEQIGEGVERLAGYLRSRVKRAARHGAGRVLTGWQADVS